MNEDIEKLIKLQGIINKNMFHLFVQTNLEDKYRWELYLYNPNVKDYLASYNRAILSSSTETIDELITYLERHGGYNGCW